MRNDIGLVLLVRYNSKRLYGKALMKVNGVPSLKYLLDRILFLFEKENVIIATSENKTDDLIVKFASNYNIKCYRGQLKNVSKRFLEASKKLNKKYIVRVTGDSIFLDIDIIKSLMNIIDNNHFLYTNRYPKTFPIGQTVDIIELNKYKYYYKFFSTDDDFEHVTSYFFNDISKFKIKNLKNKLGIQRDISLGLDSNQDFKNASQYLKDNSSYSVKTSYCTIYNYYLKNFKNNNEK